eukprot:TRINITY_DN58408_c0_g1_i1.p1 TRINITY_DN58408_c0_g1~~TRINITY_DN58408_c0_g1_i1.p1  ORF type:complete len:197 (+),score=23.94 TRINITY_DN58408_c0_g1_i1:88-591(+)
MDRSFAIVVLSAMVTGSSAYRVKESGALQGAVQHGGSATEKNVLQASEENDAASNHTNSFYTYTLFDHRWYGGDGGCGWQKSAYSSIKDTDKGQVEIPGITDSGFCLQICAFSTVCTASEFKEPIYYANGMVQHPAECKMFTRINVNALKPYKQKYTCYMRGVYVGR